MRLRFQLRVAGEPRSCATNSATRRNAESLLVPDHGRRAELRTHDELMTTEGICPALISTRRKPA